MKELKLEDLKKITNAKSSPMVSIYLSQKLNPDMSGIKERWRQSILKVERLLLKDYTRSFVHAFMEPLRQFSFLERINTFDKGIVLFYSTEEQGFIILKSNILDLVVVADSFHVKPLLRIKNTQRGYYVIGVSAKLITIYLEANDHLYRLESIRNSKLFETQDKSLSKNAVKYFLNSSSVKINKTISQHQLPIIVAGSLELVEQLKKNLSSPNVLKNSLTCNTEVMPIEEIRHICNEVLVPYYQQKELESIEDLKLAVKRKVAITLIEDIATSAMLGKVKKLFVIENKQLWGSINKHTGEISLSMKQNNSHDEDILDDICQLVLSKGGEVLVLKDDSQLNGYMAAAILSDTSHIIEFRETLDSMEL